MKLIAETNKTATNSGSDIKQHWQWIALVLAVVATLGAIILFVHFTTNVNVRIILSDPAETALLPEYAGVYTNLGVLVLWASSIFGLVSSKFGVYENRDQRGFVASFAVILGLVAIDDLFMVHEWIGLRLAHWSNAGDIADARSALEAIVFAVYIVAGGVWVWINRQRIIRSPWPLFGLGLIGFAGSVVLDLMPYISDGLKPQTLAVETTMVVLEELLKLVGIGGLAVYGYLLALPHLQTTDSFTSQQVDP